jgi:hypothetical protein
LTFGYKHVIDALKDTRIFVKSKSFHFKNTHTFSHKNNKKRIFAFENTHLSTKKQQQDKINHDEGFHNYRLPVSPFRRCGR